MADSSSCHAEQMTWPILAGIGLPTWALWTVLIEVHLRRRPRRSLADRLWRYRAMSVAAEARHWLDQS
jgi:hypothetical protein